MHSGEQRSSNWNKCTALKIIEFAHDDRSHGANISVDTIRLSN